MDRLNLTEEVSANKLASREPTCMSERPKPNPSSPALTESEFEAAKQELVNNSFTKLQFPKAIRLRQDPPLNQQNYFVFTFIPSSGATPDKDGCFGVMKMRGTFPTPREAEEWCEYLIKGGDTYNENIIGYVGRDFPLTFDSKYCMTTKEVDVRSKLDNIARENYKQQREAEKKEMEEIQERQRELMKDTTEQKTLVTDDIEYYTMLRVKKANLRILQEECEKKIKECGNIIRKTTFEISELDEKHPEYQKDYEERYKKALEGIGGDTHGNKTIEYMK